MNKLKIIFIISTFVLILGINVSYWESKTMSSSTWYKLYEERVSNFCSEYKINDWSSEIIYTIDKDDQFLNFDNPDWIVDNYKASNSIEIAKDQYRENMDNIYWCATNVSYYRALKLVKEELINKNPELNSRLKNKLEEKITSIEFEIKNNSAKCKITSEKNDSIIKKSVLKQTTYELCKYNFYLEYLKWLNEKMSSLDDETKNNADYNKAIQTVLQQEAQKKQEIQTEIDNSYKTFPVAFKAYSEYENNISIHILLELLRDDYNLLRESLHKSINPINQVVYKISNAMRK